MLISSLSLLSVLLLSACSSSDNPSASPSASTRVLGTFDKVGTLFINSGTIDAEQSTTVEMSFSEYSQPITLTADSYPLLVITDSCFVTEDSDPPALDENSIFDEPQSDISAGDVITIASQNGTFVNLMKQQSMTEQGDNFIEYLNEDVGISPQGLSLVVDIPGDQFPMVSALALPTYETAIDGVSQQLMDLQSDNTIQWAARTENNFLQAALTLTVLVADADGQNRRLLTCYVNDDGEFTIPTESISSLGANFQPSIATALRLGVKAYDVGNGALMLYLEAAVEGQFSTPTALQ